MSHSRLSPEPDDLPSLADDWHVYESASGERRLIACTYLAGVRDGVCSSPIIAFDPESQLLTTSSGRRYRLRDIPRLILLTETVRNEWQSKLPEPLRDVSRDYWVAMREHGYLTPFEAKRLEREGLVAR